MGHVQQREYAAYIDRDGKQVKARTAYRVRYTGDDGKEHTKTFRRKIDADRHLRDMDVKRERGDWIDPRKAQATVSEWAPQWLASRHLKPKTLAGYQSLLRTLILPRWGDLPLARIDHLSISQWVSGMTVSASRTRQAYGVLSSMLDLAVRAGHLPRNPAADVQLPRLPTHEMRFLTDEQVWALADAMPTDVDRQLVLALAYVGLRWGEAVALKANRVDAKARRIHIIEAVSDVNGTLHLGSPKTHQRRTVALPAFLADVLTDRLSGSELVFTAPGGQMLRNQNWRRRAFDPACAAVGLTGLRPHDLRHTCASLLIAEGASIKAVQIQLGHQSAAMTLDRYGHLFPAELDRVADAMDARAAKHLLDPRQ